MVELIFPIFPTACSSSQCDALCDTSVLKRLVPIHVQHMHSICNGSHDHHDHHACSDIPSCFITHSAVFSWAHYQTRLWSVQLRYLSPENQPADAVKYPYIFFKYQSVVTLQKSGFFPRSLSLLLRFTLFSPTTHFFALILVQGYARVCRPLVSTKSPAVRAGGRQRRPLQERKRGATCNLPCNRP